MSSISNHLPSYNQFRPHFGRKKTDAEKQETKQQSKNPEVDRRFKPLNETPLQKFSADIAHWLNKKDPNQTGQAAVLGWMVFLVQQQGTSALGLDIHPVLHDVKQVIGHWGASATEAIIECLPASLLGQKLAGKKIKAGDTAALCLTPSILSHGSELPHAVQELLNHGTDAALKVFEKPDSQLVNTLMESLKVSKMQAIDLINNGAANAEEIKLTIKDLVEYGVATNEKEAIKLLAEPHLHDHSSITDSSVHYSVGCWLPQKLAHWLAKIFPKRSHSKETKEKESCNYVWAGYYPSSTEPKEPH